MTPTNVAREERPKALERERDERSAAATAAEEAKARAEAAELAAALSAREAKNDVVAVKNDLAHARAALATARGEMDAMRAGMEEEARERERERERERAAAAATTEIEIPLDDPKDFSREAAQEMIKALTIRNAELSRELSREKKKGYGGAAVIEGVAGVLDMFFNGVDDDDDGEVGEVDASPGRSAAPEVDVEDTPRTLKKR